MLNAKMKTTIKLSLAAVVMFAFGFALVPLYDVFCDITGLNGKTGRMDVAQAAKLEADDKRTVTVEFVSIINQSNSIEFRPLTSRMEVRPNQMYTMYYYAKNKSDRRIAASASPSITPVKASSHFDKVECFCFENQAFEAKEERKMPVRFIVGAELPTDISTVSLGYTMYDITHTDLGRNTLKAN